ncbi:GtrA family protein [[Clostridium] scindens]|uniref:GtrA family protein n=1 Tax=Clostridium scindens (strain JCM 10418 / VPI 12708) TaxID=29347 RepID=UPI002ED580CA
MMRKNNHLCKVLDTTFWKFVLVGIANTIVGTVVMFAAYNMFHFNYWISSASNYVVGSMLSYFLNKYFTFQDQKKSWKQVVVFVVNISVCYVMAYGFAKPLTLWILDKYEKVVQENVSMLIGMGVFVLLNYFGQRWIVFRKQR